MADRQIIDPAPTPPHGYTRRLREYLHLARYGVASDEDKTRTALANATLLRGSMITTSMGLIFMAGAGFSTLGVIGGLWMSLSIGVAGLGWIAPAIKRYRARHHPAYRDLSSGKKHSLPRRAWRRSMDAVLDAGRIVARANRAGGSLTSAIANFMAGSPILGFAGLLLTTANTAGMAHHALILMGERKAARKGLDVSHLPQTRIVDYAIADRPVLKRTVKALGGDVRKVAIAFSALGNGTMNASINAFGAAVTAAGGLINLRLKRGGELVARDFGQKPRETIAKAAFRNGFLGSALVAAGVGMTAITAMLGAAAAGFAPDALVKAAGFVCMTAGVSVLSIGFGRDSEALAHLAYDEHSAADAKRAPPAKKPDLSTILRQRPSVGLALRRRLREAVRRSADHSLPDIPPEADPEPHSPAPAKPAAPVGPQPPTLG